MKTEKILKKSPESAPGQGLKRPGTEVSGCVTSLQRIFYPPRTVKKVQNCQDRMASKHPRAAVAHNPPDVLPVFRAVAMHRALQAGWLVQNEGTFVDSLHGVIRNPAAVAAKNTFWSLMDVMAVHFYHYFYCFAFPFYLFILIHVEIPFMRFP